jgi:hypothetical protein
MKPPVPDSLYSGFAHWNCQLQHSWFWHSFDGISCAISHMSWWMRYDTNLRLGAYCRHLWSQNRGPILEIADCCCMHWVAKKHPLSAKFGTHVRWSDFIVSDRVYLYVGSPRSPFPWSLSSYLAYEFTDPCWIFRTFVQDNIMAIIIMASKLVKSVKK